jgi:hypothetical protein
MKRYVAILLSAVVCIFLPVSIVKADEVTRWNSIACELAGPANFDTPTSNRALAIMHTAIYEAVNAITKRYPSGDLKIDAPAGASIDAAIAAASHITLSKLAPARQTEVDSAYQAAIAKIPDGKSKSDGIAVGEKAAEQILARRMDDGFTTVETYRPYTIAGVYVPTAVPLVSQ